MSHIKRLYFTEHFSVDVVRAWQAHIIESRWFLCVQGTFNVKLVAIDNFNDPSDHLMVHEYMLNSEDSKVLYIPKGYANGFQALEANSKLMIFSDFDFGVNPNDQLRYDQNKWATWN